MIIGWISAGLGNQMFQYAMARRLAHHNRSVLKLDLSVYRTGQDERKKGLEAFVRTLGINRLNISGTEASPDEIARLKRGEGIHHRLGRRIRKALPGLGASSSHFTERRYRFDETVMRLPAPHYVDGFWQSEKYFADVADLIREEFTPRDPSVLPYARDYVARLKADGNTVVALHVRRGDLAHAHEELNNVALVHGAPVTTDYIQQAIREFDSSCRFLVFSDSARDIQWCRENIKADRVSFSEGHTDVQDMMIMANCDHNIIANSTFSWWAAWLNRNPEKRVISPSRWAHQAPGKQGRMVTDDLVPKSWKMI